MEFGDEIASSISGELSDFCTVSPACSTCVGNWLCAWSTRNCDRIWSVSELVFTSKSTVSWVTPFDALVDCM